MTDVNQLITEHLDVWTSAIEKKSSAGRGKGGGVNLYGIKKLRELILELAVRGKLVPQKEDNANSLLNELKRGKASLVAKGKIKKPRQIEHQEAQERHSIPSGWLWVHLDQVGAIVGGGTPKASDPDSFEEPGNGFPWLTPADLSGHTENFIERGARDLSDKGLAKSSATAMPKDTVLFTSRAPIGYVAISTGPIATNQGFKSVVPFVPEMSRYIAMVLRCFAPEIDAAASGTTFKEVSGKIVAGILFPLPPIEEQDRIVSKVDELMALCDASERQAEDSLQAHQTLVETCLAALTNSQSPEELAQNWTRIEAHFDTLFTTEESVDHLLETVVSLSVQGRLTDRLNSDEPFASHWNKIRSSKNALASKPGTRKKKPIPEIDLSKAPFDAPDPWEWVRLDDVVDIAGGITKGRKLAGRKTFQFPYLRVANVQRGYLDLDEIKEITLPIEEADKYQLQGGDLLITEGGDWDKVGRTAIWRCEIEVMGHQNHVFRARKLVPEQHEEWFELYLNSTFARDYFAGSSKQTTNLASINMTQLRGCMVPMPPFDEQERILKQVQSLKKLTAGLKQRLSAAARIQSSISDTLTSKVH